MSHTFGKIITECCLAAGMFSSSQAKLELVEEAKKYHVDIVGVSSTKIRGSGIVDL